MPTTSMALARSLRRGDRVEIVAGRYAGECGVVTWSGIDGSCGCRSVFVLLAGPREWFGKASEVRKA
jgi:hypothetical protein